MKQIARLLSFLFISTILFGIIGCTDEATIPSPTNTQFVEVDKSSVTFNVGDITIVKARFNSVNTAQKGYKWISDDPNIATVVMNEPDMSGTITAVGKGETSIRIESLDGELSAVCKIIVAKDKLIKILAIGNDFSEDAIVNNLYDLAKADERPVVIANLYLYDASLETHLRNATNNVAAYELQRISEDGDLTKTPNQKMADVLISESWDYIVFQEVSQKSGIYSSYQTYLPDLVTYVKGKALNPNVKYLLHQTWAYATDSNHSGFANYGNNQNTMYTAIVDAVSKAKTLTGFDIIPSGTAIQNGRTSYIGDMFCRDGYHLEYNVARYVAACTWYEKIFETDITTNTYRPNTITEYDAMLARHAAHDAVANPNQVTDMTEFKKMGIPSTKVLQSPVYIGFNSKDASSPWNVISEYGRSNSIINMINQLGEQTDISMKLMGSFSWKESEDYQMNDIPSDYLSITMPNGVAGGMFKGNETTTIVPILISGLNPQKKYTFTFFSMKPSWGDVISTKCSTTGETTEELTILSKKTSTVLGTTGEIVPVGNSTGGAPAEANTTLRVGKTAPLNPKGDGTVMISLKGGSGGNQPSGAWFIGAIWITPVE